ncbi:MAG: DegT/DnrJ/EryC1/StrS family aminotransferase [Chloroflexota bacterium]|nr:DegT/DnrJ/EryC1/StrS family aminotransferase [Chloroflexota bacterium]
MAIGAKMSIPLTKPSLGDEEGRAPYDAIVSRWVTQGPRVAEFEKAVAAYVGVAHGVATASCTTGLHLALHAIGVGRGDEVIVPSLTFIASPNAVLYTGADVVFCEVDRRTFAIDPADVEHRITKRTKAIMPIDQIGLACDIDPVIEIAKRHGLQVVEDAAPAIGALYKGRQVGATSRQTVFSFHPRKVVTTGEGGMIMTNDDALARRLRTLRQHGMSVSDLARHQADRVIQEEYPEVGFNYRLSDIHAAIGVVQMRKIDAILAAIRQRAERYNVELPPIRGIEIPYEPPYARHTYQSYMIRLTKESPLSRQELMDRLLRRGIATRHGVMASHLERAYTSRYGPVSLPVTEELARTGIVIPLYASMTEDEQRYVIDALREELGAG